MAFPRKRQKSPQQTRADDAPASDGATPAAASARAEADDSPIDVMRALDALACVLRTWGSNAFDLEHHAADATRGEFEAWARHVLLGTVVGDGAASAKSRPGRDWSGLENYVADFRTGEVGEIQQNVGELRHVVWMFIQCFSKALASDERTDKRTLTQLAKLRDSADCADIVQLRAEALTAVQLVESAIETRRGRHENQVQQLSEQIDSISSELVRAKKEGTRDSLTGTHNRGSLDEHLRAMTQLGVLTSSPPMAFMIDIDHFKWINDSYGHAVGDEILRRVAAKLRNEFRRGSDQLSRFGGDEFTLVVQNAGAGPPAEIGDRILFAVRESKYECEGEAVRVSASVGGAVLLPGESAAAWLRRADSALYEAKSNGRDCCVIETSIP